MTRTDGYYCEGHGATGEISVQDVKYGTWIKKYENGFCDGKRNYTMICPFCDYSYFDNHCGFIHPAHFNYCPNCGAKMDLPKD